MRRVLIGYRINRACFGAERLQFSGGTAKLVGAWLVPWLLGIGLLGAVTYLVATTANAPSQRELDPNLVAGVFPYVWRLYGEFLLPVAIALPFAFIWYRAVEMRQWMHGTTFDQLAFASRLNLFHILLPYALYLVVLVIVIGAALVGVGLVIKLTGGPALGLPIGTPALIGIGALVTMWLIAGLLHPVLLQNWLLGNICRTLTIQGRFSPDRLFQNQQAIPRTGEGLADALDVDAF